MCKRQLQRGHSTVPLRAKGSQATFTAGTERRHSLYTSAGASTRPECRGFHWRANAIHCDKTRMETSENHFPHLALLQSSLFFLSIIHKTEIKNDITSTDVTRYYFLQIDFRFVSDVSKKVYDSSWE